MKATKGKTVKKTSAKAKGKSNTKRQPIIREVSGAPKTFKVPQGKRFMPAKKKELMPDVRVVDGNSGKDADAEIRRVLKEG